MRSEDQLICARWLRDQHESDSVRLVSDGEIGPAALHAAFLEPRLISTAEVSGGLTSWAELMTSRESHSHLHNAVQSALQHYDLPDLTKH